MLLQASLGLFLAQVWAFSGERALTLLLAKSLPNWAELFHSIGLSA
jgi:hypothetical protein